MKLSILASAFMATLASAVDIYLYPNPQCMGTALVCRNIEPGACCGSSVAVYASAKYSNPSTSSSGVLKLFANLNCTGIEGVGKAAGICGGTSFALMSASFETSLVSAVSPSAVDIPSPILSSSVVDIPLPVPTIDPSVPSDTNSTVSARGIGKRACVEPNAVSYSGRDGKTVLVQIPEEMFENVQDAVKRNDVMYLRRLTMIGA